MYAQVKQDVARVLEGVSAQLRDVADTKAGEAGVGGLQAAGGGALVWCCGAVDLSAVGQAGLHLECRFYGPAACEISSKNVAGEAWDSEDSPAGGTVTDVEVAVAVVGATVAVGVEETVEVEAGDGGLVVVESVRPGVGGVVSDELAGAMGDVDGQAVVVGINVADTGEDVAVGGVERGGRVLTDLALAVDLFLQNGAADDGTAGGLAGSGCIGVGGDIADGWIEGSSRPSEPR